MSTQPRTRGVNWYLFSLSIIIFFYTLSLGWMTAALGLPESGPDYILFGCFVSAIACTFATAGLSFSIQESRDECLVVAACVGIVGVGVTSYGIYLLNGGEVPWNLIFSSTTTSGSGLAAGIEAGQQLRSLMH